MDAPPSLYFPPFRLELGNDQLWKEDTAVPLRRKTLAVLRYLVEHPGQLVTKEHVLAAVWPGTYVEEGALTICIAELRKALGDNAKMPRFIETVHGRGYRFLPTVTAQPVQGLRFKVQGSQSAIPNPHSAINLVGRDPELTQLHRWLDKALSGERQIVFVTGEAGIGKTTLVETFLFGVRSHEEFGVEEQRKKGKRQKQKQQKAKIEPSSPAPNPQPLAPGVWLRWGSASSTTARARRICRSWRRWDGFVAQPDGEQLVTLLRQHAPTWLVQMPALLSAAELEALQRKTQGATRERMLRELGEAIEAITAERPLVLWFEDLHWSDASTLELLACSRDGGSRHGCS